MASKTTWAAEQDAELCRLWPNKSASEIGRALGKTRNAVIGRYHRLQGDYADYVDPNTLVKRARREVLHQREAAMVGRMKNLFVSGNLSRDEAIAQARISAARLKTIGDAFGITGERVRQISNFAAA